MQNIDAYSFKDKKVLVRVDFNVPLNDARDITDSTRIDKAVPTIKKILNDGGSPVLMSHLGRPKDAPDEKLSLKHLLPYLKQVLGCEVLFAADCIGDEAHEKAAELKPGEVLLLENLRFHREEKKGDAAFAAQLASLGDAYVNDAFGTAHRAHASTAIIADSFPDDKMFGYIMNDEVTHINKVLNNPSRPFTAIIGGAKVSGKIEIIHNLLDKVDNLIIGGGMMFTFIKAMGHNVGNSLVEVDLLDVAREAMDEARAKGVNLLLPVDTVLADAFDNDAHRTLAPVDAIGNGLMGLDIGTASIKTFEEVIEQSGTLLWNGPMGVFEMENFAAGTRAVAEAVARATEKGAFSLIGGGDSVAAINKYHLAGKVSYVSTGGGAMLEYIEGKELPGVAAILK